MLQELIKQRLIANGAKLTNEEMDASINGAFEAVRAIDLSDNDGSDDFSMVMVLKCVFEAAELYGQQRYTDGYQDGLKDNKQPQ